MRWEPLLAAIAALPGVTCDAPSGSTCEILDLKLEGDPKALLPRGVYFAFSAATCGVPASGLAKADLELFDETNTKVVLPEDYDAGPLAGVEGAYTLGYCSAHYQAGAKLSVEGLWGGAAGALAVGFDASTFIEDGPCDPAAVRACGACKPDDAACVATWCCVPKCDQKQCGSDGCGGTCGQCEDGTGCSESGICTQFWALAGQQDPRAVAVDETHVYWSSISEKTLRRVSIDKDAPTFVTKDAGAPQDIALDATHVYWTSSIDASLRRIVKGGYPEAASAPNPEILIAEVSRDGQIVLHQDHVYLADTDGDRIIRVLKDPSLGGEIEVVIDKQHGVEGLAIHGDSMFWVSYEDGEVRSRALVDTGPSKLLADKQRSPRRIHVDDQWVYWTNSEAQGEVWRVTHDGGVMHQIAENQDTPYDIIGDADNLYWTCEGTKDGNFRNGIVAWRRKQDPHDAELDNPLAWWRFVAQGQRHPGPLALDAKRVYWTSAGTAGFPNFFTDGDLKASWK
jgi:hypothetical protein